MEVNSDKLSVSMNDDFRQARCLHEFFPESGADISTESYFSWIAAHRQAFTSWMKSCMSSDLPSAAM